MTTANHEQLYAFLKARYKHDRFEGRAGDWCPDYPHVVTSSAMEDLETNGYSCVSHFESADGKAFFYDRTLTLLDDKTTHKYLRGEITT